jgi:predicted molibdopterin-dependent oxidoreductase YjgC
MNQSPIKTSTRLPIQRGRQFQVIVDGRPVEAFAGETVAALLTASGNLKFGSRAQSGIPGSVFCGMGVCYSCLVTINEIPNQRACSTPVTAGMTIDTGRVPHE